MVLNRKNVMKNDSLHAAALRVREQGIFLGGTIGTFESHGREQFVRLLRHGMNPDSRLLDIGCGCLRGGYWTIRFLDRGRYYGIEPNERMLEAGKRGILGPELLQAKAPSFDANDHYDFSVFGVKEFDFFLAGSIWTHAPKSHIEVMMQGVRSHSHEDSVFLGSFVRTDREGYQGESWVGKSHESDQAGLVSHRFEDLSDMAEDHGLVLKHLCPNVRGSISWLSMRRRKGA